MKCTREFRKVHVQIPSTHVHQCRKLHIVEDRLSLGPGIVELRTGFSACPSIIPINRMRRESYSRYIVGRSCGDVPGSSYIEQGRIESVIFTPGHLHLENVRSSNSST